MTTTVTVKTHGWPAEVYKFPLAEGRIPQEDGEFELLETVPPNTEREFHPHAGADILIRELPSDDENSSG